MTTITHNQDTADFVVIHPLNDVAEEKRDGANLSRMHLSRSVKVSLVVLRGYLLAMFMLVCYYILNLADVFGHHASH